MENRMKKPRFQLQRMCAYFDRAATGRIPVGKLQAVLTHFNIKLTPAEQEGIVQQYGAPAGSTPMPNQTFDSLWYEPLIHAIFPGTGIIPSPEKTVATATHAPSNSYKWAGMDENKRLHQKQNQ